MANWLINQKMTRMGSMGPKGPTMQSPLHQEQYQKKDAPNYKSVTLSNDEKVDNDGQKTTTHTYIQGGKGNYKDDQGNQRGLGTINSERFSTQNRIMTQNYKTSPNATASDKRGFRQGGPEVAGSDKFDRKSGKMIFGSIGDGIKPRGVQRIGIDS